MSQIVVASLYSKPSPMMLYETKCWAVKDQHENKISASEKKMMRWMCGKTRHDGIRNKN